MEKKSNKPKGSREITVEGNIYWWKTDYDNVRIYCPTTRQYEVLPHNNEKVTPIDVEKAIREKFLGEQDG